MIESLGSLIGLLPFDWVEYAFMQRAFIGVILLAPLFALPGCLVIKNGMSFFSDAVGHAALTGIAIGVLLGWSSPFWSMILFAALLALFLSLLRRFGTAGTDTLIGIIMAGAVSLGIVILSRNGGFTRYSRYLIGDILGLTSTDLALIAAGLLLLVIFFIFFANRLFLTAFNRSIAHSRGHPVWLEETLFSVVVAVTVTAAVQWIGILVINAFLILPAATARNLARSIRGYTFLATLFALASGLVGLVLSYYLDTATGATMVLVCLCFYGLTLLPGIRGNRAI